MIKKTKIVCTIGPASWEKETLKRMIEAGMNVARINGAFADVPELHRVGSLVRSVSDNVALMLDIKGHEVRLNKFSQALHVKPGDIVTIGSDNSEYIYPATFPELYKDISVGQKILVDGGEVIMDVKEIKDGKIFALVKLGNLIEPGKGLNLPGSHLSNPPITDIDKEQIAYAVSEDWEFISASFIRNAGDILEVKKATGDSKIKIIAKIEDQQGVDNIDEIIEVSDGIMVARGDLGSEVPFERLPIIQKELIYKCNLASKPVITATNMLESMTNKLFPTRAEITDVANAVLDGTDAVMTSAETTKGSYPVETVATMARIAAENEKYLEPQLMESTETYGDITLDAITKAAFEIAEVAEPDKILVISQAGVTPRILARYDIEIPIYAFVSERVYKNQLAITKGVSSFTFPREYVDRDQAIKAIIIFAHEKGVIQAEETVLVIGKASIEQTFFPNVFELVKVSEFIS